MPIDNTLLNFAKNNNAFAQVMAGKISTADFFSKQQYEAQKNSFMELFKEKVRINQNLVFPSESIAAAWISKLRFNEEMTDTQFIEHIQKAHEIFTKPNGLNLKNKNEKGNDLVSLMWGVETLTGSQNYDTGATRVRLPAGVARRIFTQFETGGARPRLSTHAACTTLIEGSIFSSLDLGVSSLGLGKDIEKEDLRKFTPRGFGTMLVHATSKDGKKEILNHKSVTLAGKISQNQDYDLLFKREDYGVGDTKIHTNVHRGTKFINTFGDTKDEYNRGKNLLEHRSALAMECEKISGGRGQKIHRKDHLSELKSCAPMLRDLLIYGQKKCINSFDKYTIKWSWRMSPPFIEKKIAGKGRAALGLGDFLKDLAAAQDALLEDSQEDIINKLKSVEPMLSQATGYSSFENTREGNEVLVDCSGAKAILCARIAKKEDDSAVIGQANVSELMKYEQAAAAMAKKGLARTPCLVMTVDQEQHQEHL